MRETPGRLFLLACGAALLTLTSGCGGCGGNNAVPDAGDTGSDVGDVADTDGPDATDADADTDAPPGPERNVVQPASAGGTLAGEQHRATVRIGAPQPAGEGSGEAYRTTVGPGAPRP